MSQNVLIVDGYLPEWLDFGASVLCPGAKGRRIVRIFSNTGLVEDCSFPDYFSKTVEELYLTDDTIQWCYGSVELDGLLIKDCLLVISREPTLGEATEEEDHADDD